MVLLLVVLPLVLAIDFAWSMWRLYFRLRSNPELGRLRDTRVKLMLAKIVGGMGVFILPMQVWLVTRSVLDSSTLWVFAVIAICLIAGFEAIRACGPLVDQLVSSVSSAKSDRGLSAMAVLPPVIVVAFIAFFIASFYGSSLSGFEAFVLAAPAAGILAVVFIVLWRIAKKAGRL